MPPDAKSHEIFMFVCLQKDAEQSSDDTRPYCTTSIMSKIELSNEVNKIGHFFRRVIELKKKAKPEGLKSLRRWSGAV